MLLKVRFVPIIAGQTVTAEDEGTRRCYHVPKKKLVTAVQVLL